MRGQQLEDKNIFKKSIVVYSPTGNMQVKPATNHLLNKWKKYKTFLKTGNKSVKKEIQQKRPSSGSLVILPVNRIIEEAISLENTSSIISKESVSLCSSSSWDDSSSSSRERECVSPLIIFSETNRFSYVKFRTPINPGESSSKMTLNLNSNSTIVNSKKTSDPIVEIQ